MQLIFEWDAIIIFCVCCMMRESRQLTRIPRPPRVLDNVVSGCVDDGYILVFFGCVIVF